MTLASLKGASTMVGYPRTIVSIAASVCGLACFLIIASFLLVSHPFGSAVRGYFYPIGNSRKFNSLDWSNKTIDDSFNDVNKDLGKRDIAALGFTENASDPRKEENRIEDTSRKSESTTLGDRQSETVDGSRDEMGRNETSDSQDTKDISNSQLEGGTISSPDPLIVSDKRESVDQQGQQATGNSTSSNVTTGVENAATPSRGFLNSSNTICTGLTPSSLSTTPIDTSQTDSGCDLFHGKWVYDSTGPLYTNNTCPILTQMQNCQGNGRPDKEYENWRWKPSKCDLPRFDAKKFLELMRGKTLAFIGDSVARNQMESLLCILWQVETPKNRGNKRMQRYYFRSTSTMIVRIWSSWLVHQTSDSFDSIPKNVVRLHLDAPDEGFMEFIPQFDVLVLSSGHWFAKQSVYILNNEIVGGQLWWPDKSRPMKVNNVDAFGISVETILKAIATHPNFTGLTIVRSFSPDHYEGGAWNTGGSCTGKVMPALDHELVENGFTNIMHEKQVAGFDRAVKRVSNGAKLKFMDITGVFAYRHDGHPGPYRSPDPNKVTKRGPGGKPPPQDCLHWCMPGPVDTWNELVLEMIRREFEVSQDKLNMSKVQNDPLLQVETTCGSLLYELQIIWDEVGEPETERDKMLLELEQECLEVYRRKVDYANRCRAQLRQAIADSEAELAAICSAMGERPVHIRQSDQNLGSLKEELRAIIPQLEEMQKRKCERRNQFVEVLEQIQKISNEVHRSSDYPPTSTAIDETDLSSRKLEELHRELQALQKEKSDRLNHVLDLLNTLNSLCLVLGIDFKQTVTEVHPSLGNDSEGTKNMSNETIERLTVEIQRLREVKLQRMQRLQDLATSMLELWNLMDTPIEEQQMFQNVTCNIAASEHEITEPNMLSEEFINYVEAEVSRLEELKASKMKELVLKKRFELDEICRKTHLVSESDSAVEIAIAAIESGAVDPACVLEQIEVQIAKVKEEAFSRKEILEKVEKWLGACEEECWLEEYNRDENRYNVGRGGHLILKRAEKARVLVNKLPGMVEALASKTTAWENERGIEFTYDGIRLLSMLEEYTILRQEKEQELKRQRDQKKIQGQLIAEQEALFGSKPSPMKLQNGKKGPRLSTGGPSNRRLSVGGTMMQTPKANPVIPIKATPNTRQAKKSDRLHPIDQLNHHRDDAFAALAAVNVREVDSPMKRKPFSPISSTESSKSNATNLMLEDLNRKQNEMAQKTLRNNTQFATPKKICAIEEENWTPKAVPPTPATVSVPMQTAMTPAPFIGNRVDEIPEEIEYSFEEIRFGFVHPRTNLKEVIQV